VRWKGDVTTAQSAEKRNRVEKALRYAWPCQSGHQVENWGHCNCSLLAFQSQQQGNLISSRKVFHTGQYKKKKKAKQKKNTKKSPQKNPKPFS